MKPIARKSTIVMRGLLDYLRETGQEKLLPEVSQSLTHVLTKLKKSDVCEVRSVIPLSEAQRKSLSVIIQRAFESRVPIVNTVDKELLGGFTVRINDWFLDASFSHELDMIKRALMT